MDRIGKVRPETTTSAPVRRRRVLAAAVGAAGVAILAACGGDPPTAATVTPVTGGTPTAMGSSVRAATGGAAASTAPASAAVSPPVTSATVAGSAPAEGFFPSPVSGVPDAYTKLPPPFASVAAIPGRGGKVTALITSNLPPTPARDQNRYWQELEKRLGVTWEPTLVPGSSFEEKFAAAVGGGDLPDLVTLNPTPSQLRAIQQGAFTDLTPFLTGDALKEYPNLAKIPAPVWQSLAIRGKLYGTPKTRYRAGDVLLFRGDWLEKLGIPAPKNADEFLQLATAVTKNDPDGNGKADTFALGSGGGPFSPTFFRQMFRVPNEWRKNPDGTLTYFLETDEFRQTLAYMNKLFAAGVYHPDAGTMNQEQARSGFASGKFAGFGGTITGVPDRTRDIAPINAAAKVVGLISPGFDGGKALAYNNPGYFNFAAIPAKVGRDRERVKTLLRLLDYWSAPFGSEEWLFITNGLKDVHYTLDRDGAPIRTDLGQREIGDLSYVVNGPFVFFNAQIPEMARYQQRLAQDLLAIGSDSATQGLFSPTFATKGTELAQLQLDRTVAIVTGREPLAALDVWIKDWRSRGGDMIRKEYEEGLKAG